MQDGQIIEATVTSRHGVACKKQTGMRRSHTFTVLHETELWQVIILRLIGNVNKLIYEAIRMS